jgi:glycosyltransferase involved in cell wall biosynthesis
MKLAAITRVLNEADIIEAFVRHTSVYASYHIFMDNGSSDGTLEILRKLKEEGLPLSVYQSRAITFNESDALTFLYRQVCEDFQPDWILCLDADEFIDDRKILGGLKMFLDTIQSETDNDAIKIPMVNYIATSKDIQNEKIVPRRIVHRRPPSDAYKIIVKGGLMEEGLSIQHGSHWAKLTNRKMKEIIEPNIWLAHYSERSPFQYIMKFVRGWSKVLASGQMEIERKTAYHYKGPFEVLKNSPEKLLRNINFMSFKDENESLTRDPIEYKGYKLVYTSNNDEPIRAVRSLMGLINDLSERHGLLIDEFPFVKEAVKEWEEKSIKMF